MNPKELANDKDSQKLASQLISISQNINKIRNIYSSSHGTNRDYTVLDHHACKCQYISDKTI